VARALLGLEVERMRAAGIPVGEDEYRGLYTPQHEADRLLDEWTARVLAQNVPDLRPGYVRRYWAKRNARAGLVPVPV